MSVGQRGLVSFSKANGINDEGEVYRRNGSKRHPRECGDLLPLSQLMTYQILNSGRELFASDIVEDAGCKNIAKNHVFFLINRLVTCILWRGEQNR